MSPPILDTHIHLWPSTALSPTNHAWMTDPKHILTKRHGVSDYLATAPSATGFIYVETDRYLLSPTPTIHHEADEEEAALKTWAREPLSEIAFLRRIVEGNAHEESDGVKRGEEGRMKGVVLFAPFHLSTALFRTYLRIAQETAGPRLWKMVVGFRYLLQGKGEGEVAKLVGEEDWIANICQLSKSSEYGGKEGGWVFEVGADVNRDGMEGLNAIVGMVGEVRKREAGEQTPVRFVLSKFSRLCDGGKRWADEDRSPVQIPTDTPTNAP
jgi:L-rhamnono-1,4-lactonase